MAAKSLYLVALASLLMAGPASPGREQEGLIEVYDTDDKPLRTSAIQISPATVSSSRELVKIKVLVTLTGVPREKGELLIRQISGLEYGAFYGRLAPYEAGQKSLEVECHITPTKDRHGPIVVQAMVASSYLARHGAVTTELLVTR